MLLKPKFAIGFVLSSWFQRNFRQRAMLYKCCRGEMWPKFYSACQHILSLGGNFKKWNNGMENVNRVQTVAMPTSLRLANCYNIHGCGPKLSCLLQQKMLRLPCLYTNLLLLSIYMRRKFTFHNSFFSSVWNSCHLYTSISTEKLKV